MSTQLTPEQIAFNNGYWNTLAEKSAAIEHQATVDLFNETAMEHTLKLASLDHEYAAYLGACVEEEEKRAAFNDGFNAMLTQFGFQLQ